MNTKLPFAGNVFGADFAFVNICSFIYFILFIYFLRGGEVLVFFPLSLIYKWLNIMQSENVRDTLIAVLLLRPCFHLCT